ncbi:MAG: hypothetical protein ABI671_02885 [Burkholderiales bacterium]
MTNRSNNLWVEALVKQMWVCTQIADVVAKTVGSDLRPDLQTQNDASLRPIEPRLNPLEFHGKRRSASP